MGHEGQQRSEEETIQLYDEWLARHGRGHSVLGEKERRFQVFKDNLRFVDAHNAGLHSFRLGLNRFADMTNEEYRAIYLGMIRSNATRRSLTGVRSDRYKHNGRDKLPKSVDWRAKGAVAPVKDQGSCGQSPKFMNFHSFYSYNVISHNGNIFYIIIVKGAAGHSPLWQP